MYGSASLAYAAAWALSWRRVTAQAAQAAVAPGGAPAGPPARAGSWRDAAHWSLLAAVLLHGVSIVLPLAADASQLHFGFAQALSTALWLGAALLWFESFAVPFGLAVC